jgi:5-methylcytosine-specific restriction endonuclease McrA
MARDFAKKFYKSEAWQRARHYALCRDLYICRKCGKPAEEVHHVKRLTPDNITDATVSLDPDNLVSLCRDCHFAEH